MTPNDKTVLAMVDVELQGVLAQLRHAYGLLARGFVIEKNHKKFADGLIAPQIRKLEKLQQALTCR
jgi:hypothetical protein